VPADDHRDAMEVNRQAWDERVPIHVQSEFYDVEGFKSGRPALEPFEVEELGALGGCQLVHLQCHFGLDTLDLVRLHPTLTAVGVDFSEPAIETATSLAKELDLADRARFVNANVYDAPETLGRAAFDVIYTGKGALCWLPYLDRWAGVCAELIRPGGFLYLCEYHPVAWVFDEERPAVKYDYFATAPFVDDTPGTYADRNAVTENNVNYVWQHTTSQVIDSIITAGFKVSFFHEWDWCHSDLGNWLVKGDDGRYRWPPPGRLPLMYSLKAEREPPPSP
jgi:SAM-dependent methyltransferase